MSTARQDPFVRAAQFVGDFGNPFYAEERQRDIWNEASAFGLQLAVWAALLVATVTVWVVGGPSVPYVLGALVVVGVVCLLTVAYAQRLGIDLTTPERMLRWRMVPLLALLLVLAGGLLRARAGALSSPFATGLATGAALAVLLPAVTLLRARRRTS